MHFEASILLNCIPMASYVFGSRGAVRRMTAIAIKRNNTNSNNSTAITCERPGGQPIATRRHQYTNKRYAKYVIHCENSCRIKWDIKYLEMEFYDFAHSDCNAAPQNQHTDASRPKNPARDLALSTTPRTRNLQTNKNTPRH